MAEGWMAASQLNREMAVSGQVKTWKALLLLAQRGLDDDGCQEDREEAFLLSQEALPLLEKISQGLWQLTEKDAKSRQN